MPDIVDLQKTLGIIFKEPALLERALVHSSYVNEYPTLVSGHNERLEFLGDAILDFIVADKLYRDLPDLTEGEMTKLRAALVRRETLTRVARSINLGDYLLLGKGEESSGGRSKKTNLAGAVEAVIAAIYFDQGIEITRETVIRLLRDEWERILGQGTVTDYKSRLQELSQSRLQLMPAYRLVAESGPDHDKTFTVEVMVGDKILGRGTGKSKKLAETEAARVALERLQEGFTE